MKQSVLSTFLFFVLLSLSCQLPGQIPGNIKNAATPAVNPMDPNGDGWATLSGSGFTVNEKWEFELPFHPMPTLYPEPLGDQVTGGSCGTTDIVEDTAAGALYGYMYFDPVDAINDNGDDVLIFRMRLGNIMISGNFGYSFLLDTDGRFGFTGPQADSNAVSGNPGFELELRIQSGAQYKVWVDNIDGTTSGTNIINYPLAQCWQQVFAYHTDPTCAPSRTPVFHDAMFRINDFGLYSSSPIRLMACTSMNGASVLGSAASDFGGVNDRLYSDPDSMMVDFILNQDPTPIETFGGGGVLPVGFLGFEGWHAGSGVQLEWATSNESNTSHFTVERSADLKSFRTIGVVPAAGSAFHRTGYQLRDEDPVPGSAWYRLVQTDQDGTDHVLGTIVLSDDLRRQTEVNVHPNPTQGQIVVNWSGTDQETACLQFSDLQGRILFTQKVQESGSLQLDMSAYPQGMYFVKVQDRFTYGVRKILKQ